MTIPLQIGDIVRINAPTPEEKSILAELYDAITDDDTGRLAVVIDIKHQSNPLVSVVPCDENFELTVEGIPELRVNNVIYEPTLYRTHLGTHRREIRYLSWGHKYPMISY